MSTPAKGFAINEFEIRMATSSKSMKSIVQIAEKDVSLPQTNTGQPAVIKELDSIVTRKICTGQVIVSLEGACRELIDNSIDSCATFIDIRLKENGVESLEVIDNGYGIEKSNFEFLCKPHSTSKLSNIDDFNKLTTFGFRGEALNALAALSEVTIITRDKSAAVGSRLSFDKNGQITKVENCSRLVGTSVIISNLFYSLPVRRQEFQRNSKKELSKMLHCIQSFALSTSCRFSCTNLLNGKQYPLLFSPGGVSLKDTITNLFGANSEKGNVLKIEEALPTEEISIQYGLKNADESVIHKICLSGMVSSSEYGQGRSANDRQFIFANKRPVDLPKLNRIVNEVYSSHNRGRCCMLVLFIDVPPETIDVNVSPDKRNVFFRYEKELFAKLRASMQATFIKVLGVCPKSSTQPPAANQSFAIIPESQLSGDGIYETSYSAEEMLSQQDSFSFDAASPSTSLQFDYNLLSDARPNNRKRQLDDRHENSNGDVRPLTNIRIATNSLSRPKQTDRNPIVSKNKSLELFSFQPILQNKTIAAIEILPNHDSSRTVIGNNDEVINTIAELSCLSSSSNIILRPQQNLIVNMDAFRTSVKSKRVRQIRKRDLMKSNISVEKSSNMDERETENEAEHHLSILLRKDDFSNMQIVGQFNNSFIIARLKNELFMIDQHASDEKFSFEELKKNARIGTQKLYHPQMLHLGAVHENVLRDNIDVLQGNGFDFSFNDAEHVGNRVCLTSVPVIQGYEFRADDIDEILSFLIEFPGVFYRPKKFRAIFASKACRKSVMFGKALTKHQMRNIVQHMGTMENCWSCPHGRPTIRHLCRLKEQFL